MRLGLGLGLNRIALGGGGAQFTFGLSEDGSSYTLSGYSGDPVTFTIGGEDYLVDPDNIVASAPVIIPSQDYSNADEDVSGDLSTGDTITVTLPAVAFDPDGGVPVITWVLKNATGTLATDTTTYVKTGTDYIEVYGLQIEITATNGYGSTVETLDVIEAPAYTEEGLTFPNGTYNLKKDTGIYDNGTIGVGADNVLMVANFVWQANDTLLPRSRANGTFDNDLSIFSQGGVIRLYVRNQSNELVINFKSPTLGHTLTAGDRIFVAVYASKDGYWSYAGHVEGVRQNSEVSSTGGLDGTTLRSDRPATYVANGGTLYDVRSWANLASDVDVTTDAFVSSFINSDGTSRNPLEAEIIYGTPEVIVPTNITDANALTNNGTGLDFTSKGTTWT